MVVTVILIAGADACGTMGSDAFFWGGGGLKSFLNNGGAQS